MLKLYWYQHYVSTRLRPYALYIPLSGMSRTINGSVNVFFLLYSHSGEMPAPVSLPSIKRQRELEEEELQQMMSNKPSVSQAVTVCIA